jgi:hypothetical protein
MYLSVFAALLAGHDMHTYVHAFSTSDTFVATYAVRLDYLCILEPLRSAAPRKKSVLMTLKSFFSGSTNFGVLSFSVTIDFKILVTYTHTDTHNGLHCMLKVHNRSTKN